jgi:hypothetical protein
VTTYAKYPYAVQAEAFNLTSLATDPSADPVGSLIYNSTTGHFRGKNAAGWVDLDAQVSGGTAPIGPAGGSLAGTYPNPTLATSGATAGTYGDKYNVAKVTVNAEGRVTAVVQVLIRARWG